MVFPRPPVRDRWFQHENISSENNWPLVANRRGGSRQNGERPETHCGCKQSQIHSKYSDLRQPSRVPAVGARGLPCARSGDGAGVHCSERASDFGRARDLDRLVKTNIEPEKNYEQNN